MPWRFVDNWTEFVAEFQPRDPRPLSHRFCGWDSTPDLAQATWEWPPKRKPTTAQVLYDGMKLAAAEYAQMMRSAEWTEPILKNL